MRFARRSDRHAASDFLKMEQERGISVSTAVASDYEGFAVNLLDTPGHADGEDTYRVLTAVDSALMCSTTPRALRSNQVTYGRMSPSRYPGDDPEQARPGDLDPFEIMENVEENLNIACAPLTWPIGMGKDFGVRPGQQAGGLLRGHPART